MQKKATSANSIATKLMGIETQIRDSNKSVLIRELNFYSGVDYNSEDSKKFALNWVKQNKPEYFDVLSNTQDIKFKNRGFVCRIIERGFVFSSQELESHYRFFDDLYSEELKSNHQSKKEEKPAVERVEKHNSFLDSIEYSIDDVILWKTPQISVSGVTKLHLKQGRDRIVSVLNSIEIDSASDERYYNSRVAKVLKKTLSEFLIQIDAALSTQIKKPRKATKDKIRELNTKLLLSKLIVSDREIPAISATLLVGKKTAIVFNVKTRILTIYKSAEGLPGLDIKGNSIINISNDFGTGKKIRSVIEFFEKIKMNSQELMKSFEGIKAIPSERSGRLNSDSIILAVS